MIEIAAVLSAVAACLLARREAIFARLAEIEALTGVDILCSQKIKTPTRSRLTLGDPFVAPPSPR